MTNAQILVVEDEPIVAKSIKMELESIGYTVPAVAHSGEEALQQMAETQPDLVLMDVVLKGDMDGVETTERLQEQFDVPVVYLTAYADDDTLQRAKETEPFGYLLKPYEERELQTTIEVALYKHKTERLLRESRRWLASSLQCIGDGVIVTDAQGCVRIINPVGEAMTGWPQKEALGKDLPDVFHLISEGTFTNPTAKALQKGTAVRLAEHAHLVARDGREIPVEGTVAPVYDGEGCFTGFVLTFRDVVGRLRAGEAVPPSDKDLRPRQPMEAIDRLAGGAAHHLSQLLTVILVNLSSALASLPKGGPDHKSLVAAERAAAHAAEVVKHFFHLSRKTKTRREPLDLNTLVREMVEIVSGLMGPRIHIEFTPAPDLWTVPGDRGGVNEVLLNVCLNARDAMPDGGQLLLQTMNVVVGEGPRPANPQARPGEYVCLRVRDTGKGMSPEIRSRIFEPFFTTKGPEKGTGLGLALVAATVARHGGWIDCRSEVGRGTRFEIYWPRHGREALPQEANACAP